jgi:hypothetical protein
MALPPFIWSLVLHHLFASPPARSDSLELLHALTDIPAIRADGYDC